MLLFLVVHNNTPPSTKSISLYAGSVFTNFHGQKHPASVPTALPAPSSLRESPDALFAPAPACLWHHHLPSSPIAFPTPVAVGQSGRGGVQAACDAPDCTDALPSATREIPASTALRPEYLCCRTAAKRSLVADVLGARGSGTTSTTSGCPCLLSVTFPPSRCRRCRCCRSRSRRGNAPLAKGGS